MKEDDDFIYRLVGVNIHRGTAQHGHYWSLINIARGAKEKDGPNWGKVEDDAWKRFDDDEVHFQSYRDLHCESFGGDETSMKESEINTFISEGQAYGKSAYMLIYERKTKGPIREIKIKNEVTEADRWAQEQRRDKVAEALAKVDAAEAKHSDQQEEQKAAASEPAEVEMSTGDADKVKAEFVEMIEWKKIPPFVPEWINDMVRHDNTEFVIDRQVFHFQFFYLVKLVLKHIANNLCMTQHTYGTEYSKYFYRMKSMALKIAHKVMFDFLSHYNENATMVPISESMSTIFTFSDSFVSFVSKHEEPSILCEFIQRFYLEDKCKYLFEIMFNCPDAQARFNIGRVTSNVINKAFRIVGICSEKEEEREHPKVVQIREAIEEFMNLVLTTMHERECQKNWNRLVNFYTMISDIGTGGKYQTEYMLKRGDVVVDLCDIMLQQKSPKALDEPERRVEMGGSVTAAPFGPLVILASHLVCSMHTERLDPESKTFTKFKDEKDLNAPEAMLK